VTINEPNVYAVLGWSQVANHMIEFTTPSSDFPPGKDDVPMVFKVVDHMLLAHGAAYHAIHRVQPQARVGLAHHMRLFDPARSGSPLDRLCAWNRDRLFNCLPLNAMIAGHLDRPIGLARRIRQLKSTADFIGLNYYSRDLIQFDRHGWKGMVFGRNMSNPSAEMSDMNAGEIYPRGLFRLLKRLPPKTHLHHRKRPARSGRRSPPELFDSSAARGVEGHQRERAGDGLLSLDVGGQLRMGGRLESALWPGEVESRNAGTHPAAQRRDVRRDGAHQRH
jgi:beta-glucosidase